MTQMIDPQQELFTALRQALAAEYGEGNVYDGYLPPEGTPYPFVYLADNQITDEQNKTGLFARVTQSIHVWSNTPKKRGSMSAMIANIKSKARSVTQTDHFGWEVKSMYSDIRPDDTTKTPLLHGIITITYECS